MFMLDIQGDPKGLSIGGLVVINKSMSLTVKSVFIRDIRKYLRCVGFNLFVPTFVIVINEQIFAIRCEKHIFISLAYLVMELILDA